MKSFTLLAAAAAALAFAAPAAQAVTVVYTAVLNGASESPPNGAPGFGTATVTFNFDTLAMRVQSTFTGLSSGVTAAHIHCCTAVALTGTAGVATVTPSFTGFPSGVTAGTYDQTFDMGAAASYNAAFITAQGSLAAAIASFEAGLGGGKTYFNIHTTNFGGGEIRGFLAAPIPEPSTYALMALGLMGVAAAARKRRA